MPPPEVRFVAGNCSATVFVNTVQTPDGPKELRNVKLQRSYRDPNGELQWTGSLRTNDIPKAILTLQRAFEHLVTSPSNRLSAESLPRKPAKGSDTIPPAP